MKERSAVFIAASATVILLLGVLHLMYTVRGEQLSPRDPDLRAKMMTAAVVISRETTMWGAWVGFNASHSAGLMLFGTLYGYLALCQSALLLRSWFLLGLGLAFLIGYAGLAKLYWFSAPFRLIVLAVILYVLGIVFKPA